MIPSDLAAPLTKATNTLFTSAAIALFSALIAYATILVAPIEAAENMLGDYVRTAFAARTPDDDNVVVILIDDAVVDRELDYISPIKRSFLARLINKIDASNPRAIGLDIFLDRPTADDEALARALQSLRAPIVVATAPSTGDAPGLCTGRAPESPPVIEAFRAPRLKPAYATLCMKRSDSVVRKAYISAINGRPASFAAVIANAAGGPSARRSPFRITYTTGIDSKYPFVIVSAQFIDLIDSSAIEGKIVLIGTANAYHDDWHLTPLRYSSLPDGFDNPEARTRDMTPGVIVHAYIIRDLLAGATARTPTNDHLDKIALLAVALLGVAFAQLRAPALFKMATVFIIAFLVFLFILYIYKNKYFLLYIIPSLSSFIIAYGGASLRLEARERRIRAYVTRAFGKFVSPRVVDRLVREPQSLARDAHEREISILFTDIEGFSRFVEENEPEAVQSILNEYFDRLIECVERHDGIVDKIIGDSIQAIFSAPIVLADHTRRAVECALDMEDAAEQLKAELKARGVAFGRTRIGAHTGPALVGNFGSSNAFNYTAYGRVINIASRLEGANKTIGTAICVSEQMFSPGDRFLRLLIGDLVLRGQPHPVTAYEPTRDAAFAQLYAEAYDRALGEGRAATSAFQALAKDPRHGNLAQFQLARLDAGAFGKVIAL